MVTKMSGYEASGSRHFVP